MSGTPAENEFEIGVTPGPHRPTARGDSRTASANPTHSKTSTAVWVQAAVLAVAATALYLYGITGFPLAEPDEGRYAEIPREMLLSGDWVTPRLNFVKYFEKPPLVYWATALSFLAFGENEFAARLPSTLAALGTIALTAILAASAYGPSTALLASTILATSPFFAFMGIILTLDMSLTFAITLCYTATWLAYQRGHRPLYRLTWIAAALGVLIKGPVTAVLAFAGQAPFLLAHGGFRQLRVAAEGKGILLAAAIAVPWFVLVSLANPEFVEFFVIDQHIARYLWKNEHGQPLLFFIALVPAMMLPWSLAPLFQWREWRTRLSPRAWSPATRLLVLWATVIIGFFSLSGSKLATYALPALPPIAILLARGMIATHTTESTSFFRNIAAAMFLLGVTAAVCGVVLPHFNDHWRVIFLRPTLLLAGLVLAGSAVALRATADRPTLAIKVLSAAMLLFLLSAMSGRDVAGHYKDLSQAAARVMQPGDRLVVFRHYVQGVPFYSGQRPVMVESWGELGFGSRQGDQSEYFWAKTDQLLARWTGAERLFLIINRKELAALAPPLPEPHTMIASQGKKVLLVNEASPSRHD